MVSLGAAYDAVSVDLEADWSAYDALGSVESMYLNYDYYFESEMWFINYFFNAVERAQKYVYDNHK